MEERICHYVRKVETTRLPRRHIFLDTESKWSRTRRGRVQEWRLGVARYRIAEKGRKVQETERQYHSPDELWRDVANFCRGRNRTVLWAHNLGYDVRISQSFTILPTLGWECVAHNLASRGTWIHWRKGAATLIMTDSSSIYHMPLEQLGKHFQQTKLPLPDDDDSNDAWMARCVRDVQILSTAIVAYLDWLERDGMGPWQLTGAGQSYADFRARHLTHMMLVHADTEALEAERRAMWTGRCEAYYRGRTGHHGTEEWDISTAYARVAERARVPTRLIGEIPVGDDISALLSRRHHAVLADVEVEIERPTAPAHVDGYMAWPVGGFGTTLWAPELELARADGGKVHVRRAWLYATTPALQAWAQWGIGQLGESDDVVPAWQKAVIKTWLRALIGRFGMRYTAWADYAKSADARVLGATIYDLSTGEEFTLSHVGTNVFRSTGEVEWSQSQPAITGYVMSCARVWLWRIMDALPPRAVLYCDTDSVYVDARHHDAVAQLAATPLGQGLRHKATYGRMTILGPRQIVVDGRPRVSGLPKGAVALADGTYRGEVWSSLRAGMERGDVSTVHTQDRVWRLAGADHRRVAGPDGWTTPIRVEGGVRVDMEE